MSNAISDKNRGEDVSADVLEALRCGEQWAFDVVYARYATPLKNFIAALISNEEDAKELNHDVFLSLWNGRDKIVPGKGIKGFLYMRAKNLAMNYFDHEKVKKKYDSFCLFILFKLYMTPWDFDVRTVTAHGAMHRLLQRSAYRFRPSIFCGSGESYSPVV